MGKIIDKLQKLTLKDNEIIHIKCKPETPVEVMGDLARIMKEKFPNLDGKWIITDDTIESTVENLDEFINRLIQMRNNLSEESFKNRYGINIPRFKGYTAGSNK